MDTNERFSPHSLSLIYLTRLVFLPSHLAGTAQAAGAPFGRTAASDHSRELQIVVSERWMAGKGAGEPAQTDSQRHSGFELLHPMKSETRKDAHLLAISCRFGP